MTIFNGDAFLERTLRSRFREKDEATPILRHAKTTDGFSRVSYPPRSPLKKCLLMALNHGIPFTMQSYCPDFVRLKAVIRTEWVFSKTRGQSALTDCSSDPDYNYKSSWSVQKVKPRHRYPSRSHHPGFTSIFKYCGKLGATGQASCTLCSAYRTVLGNMWLAMPDMKFW